MEGYPVIEREHTRVHEENKTEAGKVRWVRQVQPVDMTGQSSQTMWVWPVEDGDKP